LSIHELWLPTGNRIAHNLGVWKAQNYAVTVLRDCFDGVHFNSTSAHKIVNFRAIVVGNNINFMARLQKVCRHAVPHQTGTYKSYPHDWLPVSDLCKLIAISEVQSPTRQIDDA
jgi:hypothetical protein